MKVQNVIRLSARNLEAGMQTEFGKLKKVVKFINTKGPSSVLLETAIMQFDLKATQSVIIYEGDK